MINRSACSVFCPLPPAPLLLLLMLVAVPHRHELLLLLLLAAAASCRASPGTAAAAVDLARTIPLPALPTTLGPTHPDTSTSGAVLEMLKASSAAVAERHDEGILREQSRGVQQLPGRRLCLV